MIGDRSYLTLLEVLRDTLKSGASLLVTFQKLSEDPKIPKKLKDIFSRVTQKLSQNSSLIECFKDEKDFPPTFLAILSAGSTTGRLVEMLDNEIEEVKELLKIKREFIGAMVYPTLIFIFFSIGMSVLWLIVRYAVNAITSTGDISICKLGLLGKIAQLPVWVPPLISLSLIATWIVFLILSYRNLDRLRFLTFPGLRKLALSRILKTLGLLLSAGLTWDSSISLVKRLDSSLPKSLNSPEDLAELLRDPRAKALISSGKDIGELDSALITLGDEYREAGLSSLRTFTRAFSLIVIVLVLVSTGLTIAYSAYMIITSIYLMPLN